MAVNYHGKKLYDIGPRWQHGSWKCCAIFYLVKNVKITNYWSKGNNQIRFRILRIIEKNWCMIDKIKNNQTLLIKSSCWHLEIAELSSTYLKSHLSSKWYCFNRGCKCNLIFEVLIERQNQSILIKLGLTSNVHNGN